MFLRIALNFWISCAENSLLKQNGTTFQNKNTNSKQEYNLTEILNKYIKCML